MSACIVIDSVLIACIIVCVYCLLVSYYLHHIALVASVCCWCVWVDYIYPSPLHIIVLVGCVYCFVACALSCLHLWVGMVYSGRVCVCCCVWVGCS